jgi:16S rRNA (guanine966-N2)-methyltransferase
MGVVVAGTLPDTTGHLRGGPWDLVFLDPPYGDHLVGLTLAALAATGALASGAFVAAEYSKDQTVDSEDLPSGLTWDTTRTYGGTCVSIWEAL